MDVHTLLVIRYIVELVISHRLSPPIKKSESFVVLSALSPCLAILVNLVFWPTTIFPATITGVIVEER